MNQSAIQGVKGAIRVIMDDLKRKIHMYSKKNAI